MFTKEEFSSLRSMADVFDLSPHDFEWFCKFLLEYIGYHDVFVTKKYGEYRGDGGVDIRCTLNDEEILVQCKKWIYGFNGFLNVRVIRELGGCMLRDQIYNGIVISTLPFDHSGRRDAEKMNIRLIDAAEIASHMRSVNPRFNAAVQRPSKHKIWRFFIRLFRLVFGFDKTN